MGTTCEYRAPGRSNLDWMREQVEWIGADGEQHYDLLDAMTVRNAVIYAAVRDRQTNLVSCWVTLISWTRGGFNFCHKELDEGMGPGEATCPERILDLLSPTDELYGPVLFKTVCDNHSDCRWADDPNMRSHGTPHVNQRQVPDGRRAWADEFRAASRAAIAERKARPKITRGTRVRMNTTRGEGIWELVNYKAGLFHQVIDGHAIPFPVRIRGWRRANLEVVNP